MAPVLAIPVLTRPDELARCLQSIDTEVDLLVIDNSPQGFAAATIVENYEGDFYVTEPPANLGFSASVNLAIRTHPADPFWLVANADVVFGAGDLDRLTTEAEKGGARWVGLTDWRVFALTAEAVDAVGFWDENYHPCYVEDCDYEWRCHLAGVPFYALDSSTEHIRSIVLEDAKYARANAKTYPSNLAYHAAKWGGPPRGGERFDTPFDAGGGIGDWRLSRERLAANDWT